jgi:hypothetical protein
MPEMDRIGSINMVTSSLKSLIFMKVTDAT